MSNDTSEITTPGSPGLDPKIQNLVDEINRPENQGTPLLPRDYVTLFIVTLGLPIALTVWGVLNA